MIVTFEQLNQSAQHSVYSMYLTKTHGTESYHQFVELIGKKLMWDANTLKPVGFVERPVMSRKDRGIW